MKKNKCSRIKVLIYTIILTGFIFTIAFVLVSNTIIIQTTQNYVYNNVEDLKECKTGLLLGTSKFLKDGRENLYFKYRINAAVELYNSGKIKYIIVSGDNHITSYNEPEDMRIALIENGIPENVIYLDYAGFRTLDSVIRCKEIFGQSEFIVISQKFHNQRAVYIANKNDIKAYGYNAKDVSAKIGIKTNIREIFAKAKVFVDLILNVEPKFYGDKIVIGD